MIHKIFSIHDSAAKAYLPPFFLPEEGQAIRGFKEAINNPDHSFGKWPADYSIMCIGEFDDNKGTIKTYQTMKPLGNGLSFVQTKTSEDQLQLLQDAAS